MTIVTKPLTGAGNVEKKKPADVEPDLEEPVLVQVELGGDASQDEPDLRLQYLSNRANRIGRATHTCLVLTIMLASIMGLLAGVHIYRNLFLQGNYRGVCRIPLSRGIRPEDTLVAAKFENPDKQTGDSSSLDMFALFNQGETHPEESRGEKQLQIREMMIEPDQGFEFDYELDLEMNDFEQFELPEIFSGRYMHDFKVNYTAIIDSLGKLCFILPLDRNVIPPPTSIFDILRKMRDGVFDVDYDEIRQTYRIAGPQIEMMDNFGTFIPKACTDKRSFRLEQMTTPILKRSTTTHDQFGEFVGNKLVKYNILNLRDVKK
jgi:hypothetical protein